MSNVQAPPMTIRVGALGVRFLVEAGDANGSVAMFECGVPALAARVPGSPSGSGLSAHGATHRSPRRPAATRAAGAGSGSPSPSPEGSARSPPPVWAVWRGARRRSTPSALLRRGARRFRRRSPAATAARVSASTAWRSATAQKASTAAERGSWPGCRSRTGVEFEDVLPLGMVDLSDRLGWTTHPLA